MSIKRGNNLLWRFSNITDFEKIALSLTRFKIRKTMKAIAPDYIFANHPDVANGAQLIVQTRGPQIVGVVFIFGPNASREQDRREFLSKYSQSDRYFAKANGYRVYVVPMCGLKNIYEQRIDNWEELLRTTLQEMAEFRVSTMSEGDRNRYADKD